MQSETKNLHKQGAFCTLPKHNYFFNSEKCATEMHV